MVELQTRLGTVRQSGFSDEAWALDEAHAARQADAALAAHLVAVHFIHLPNLDPEDHRGCVGCFEWTLRAPGGVAVPGEPLYEEFLHAARHLYAAFA
ncbi:hypothetical protein ACSNOI_24500 [Actinomadura kijaniata]|uniref:hypothetical protein n=1 Tax=Actinomadura kijaniata TaxID=46161 RepID=UPI003F1A553F